MSGLTVTPSLPILPAPAPPPARSVAAPAPTPDGPATIVELSELARPPLPSLVATLRDRGFTDDRIAAIAASLPASVFEGEKVPEAMTSDHFGMPADLSSGIATRGGAIESFGDVVKAVYGLNDEQAEAWTKAFFEQKALAATRGLADELRRAVQRQREIVSGEN